MPDQHAALQTLALALALGSLLLVISRRLQLPTIVFLFGGGVLFGPEVLGWIHPESLGDVLPAMVSLAVGVILFEGGLTLDLAGYSAGSRVIKRLLTVGVLITWLGIAGAVWLCFDVRAEVAVLAGSLVIVTGPTVILPLLKRIRIQPRLHHILHWEGVLIDAIGVFIALLCFEWVTASGGGGHALVNFAVRSLAGISFGLGGGWAIYLLLKWRVAPDHMVNIFALALAVLLFALTELVRSEAGLMAVVIAGLVVGSRHPIELKRIKQFKADITDLLIGMLFMLLASRLELDQFRSFGTNGIVLLACVLFVVRPLSALVCAQGSNLNWRERVFLGWVAPRGIVAASMASLFALELSRRGAGSDARFLETFTYSVIIATVVLQGFSAGFVAWLLRIQRPDAKGWMLLGAHGFARGVAEYITSITGSPTVLIDRDKGRADRAALQGHLVIWGDAIDPGHLETRPELEHTGSLLALTDNSDLNELACQRWSDVLGRDHLFRWSAVDHSQTPRHRSGVGIWSDIPLPSKIAAEIRDGESSLETMVVGERPNFPAQSWPLLRARGERISVIVEPGRQKDFRKGDRVLLLVRAGGYLVRALAAGGLVELAEPITSFSLAPLLEQAKKRVPELDITQLQQELADRARALPFEIGHGVNVPHARSRGITQPICILGRRVQDNVLIFLLLSPVDDGEGHLATMGEIARICHLPTNRDSLLSLPALPDIISYMQGPN